MSASIVSLLPFRPRTDQQVRELLEKLVYFVIIGKGQKERFNKLRTREQRIERLKKLFQSRSFVNIFGKDGSFELAFEAVELQYASTVPQNADAETSNKHFMDACEAVFEKATGRKRYHNEGAFRMFASFVRRKHNYEIWLRDHQ